MESAGVRRHVQLGGRRARPDPKFFCGSGKEVRPIGSVDRHRLRTEAPGEITRTIRDTYFDVVRGRRSEFGHWLTPVWKEGAP